MDGNDIFQLVSEMFPICRSITGNGVRKTFEILRKVAPDIQVHEVPSGTQVFDWTVPAEWNIEDAYVEDPEGNKIIDFQKSNLSVVGYSLPMDEMLSLEDLKKILYTQPDQPDVIPYVTSYYKERSGFCLPHKVYENLKEGTYHAVIKSSLNKEGSLTYGEAYFPGETKEEILISTYTCHPSMANNECSGPAVSVFLQKYIKNMPKRRYSYRFVYIPETIGSITYLSTHYKELKENVVAGINLSCVGDNNNYSFVSTRYGDTLTDRLLENILSFHSPDYKKYSFLDRGSDERQYCAPGIDLPVCTFCRTKYCEYPEYHTSADNLDYVSPEGLDGAFQVMKKFVHAMEYYGKYEINCLCEPQLGKRGLYPTISKKGSYDPVKTMTNFIAYSDGREDLVAVSDRIHAPIDELIPVIDKLTECSLLSRK